MKYATARAAFTLLASLVAAACGGAAFSTGGGGADGGTSPLDATAESSVEAGVDTGTGPGADGSTDTGVTNGSDASTDGSSGCTLGSQCSTGFCKVGMCAPCTVNMQCATNQYCDQVSGDCKPTKTIGTACLGPGECTSGFCADGVCCSTACTGTCSACNTPSATGTCSPVPAGMNNPLRPCASGNVCCPVGSANDEACIDTANSPDNCGMCGHTCTTNGSGCQQATCSSGTCDTTNLGVGTSCGDAGGKCTVAGLCL